MIRSHLVLFAFAFTFRTSLTQTCNCDTVKLNDIGIEDGHIPDSSFTASSSLDAFHGPSRARLNQASHAKQGSAWCAGTQDSKQYLQVDLVYSSKITHIATQGRFDPPQSVNGSNVTNWIKHFTLHYSSDGERYTPYNLDGKAKVFEANNDGDSVKCCQLPYPLVVQYVRIQPTSWQGKICTRIGIYGKGNVTAHAIVTSSNIRVGHYWWWLMFWVIIIFIILVFVILLLVYCCCLRKRSYATQRANSMEYKTSSKKNQPFHPEDPRLSTSSVVIYNSTTIREATPYIVQTQEDEVQEVVADFTEEGFVEVQPSQCRVVSFSVEDEDESQSPVSQPNRDRGDENARDGRGQRNGTAVYNTTQ